MTPYRVHYVSDIEGWAYWFSGSALRDYAPPHVTFTMGCRIDQRVDGSYALRGLESARGADVVLNMVYQNADNFEAELSRVAPNALLVTSFNCGYSNGGMEHVRRLAQNSTHVLFNSRGSFLDALRAGDVPPERASFISNGVDQRIFKCRAPIADRPRRLLWVGSMGQAKIKGYGILQRMQPEFAAAGFETDFKLVDSAGPERLTLQKMADWYQTGFSYVCLSESEGTPNPCLEAAACGCVVITTRVGNMPELIIDRHNGVILEDREPATILEALQYAETHRERLTANMLDTIRAWDWKERSKRYFELFDRLTARRDSDVRSHRV